MVVGVGLAWGVLLEGVCVQEWPFPLNRYVLFADLCDHALQRSHDEL